MDTWTGADFSVGNKDDFDLTMTRTFTCEGVTIDVELGLDKTEDDVTASGIQVVLTNGAEPIGLVGINDAEFGGVPYIKEWDNGWGDAEALPPGVTVTGVAGGTDFSISVDLAVLNAILGDTSTLGWAVNAEADWKDTAGSSQKHFPADWTRWTANGAYHETLNFFGTTDTVVTLVCEDVGPHPSGGEVVHWALHRTEDGETWEQVDGGVTRNQDTVTFDQTSLHRLSAWCIDAVDKMSEQDVEYFKIDDEAPVLTKTLVGPHDGPDCPAGTDQVPDNGDMEAECYLKMGETEVHLSVEDFMEGDAAVHYSGGAYCTYTIKYDGVYEHYDGGYFDEDNPAVIVFEYDSEHILSVTCKDLLGNTMSDVERFLVDGTPPVTDKDYGQPMVFDGTYRWITSSTPITLEADDEKIGVAYINYSVEWVSDDVCEAYPDVVGPVADVSGGTFEFKSTNEENIGTNRPHVVMLDANSTHVVLEVNYGGPLMSCFEVRPDGDTSLSSGSNPWYDIPDYYNTAPHFTCLTGPDSAILEVEADGYVEVRVSVGAESDWYFDWVRFDVAPEWTMVEGESVEFTIDETSCHVIRYFAVDKFGHEEEMQQQFVMVDNQAPNGTKIVGEPKIVVEDEICIVDDAPGSGAGFDGQTGESSYGSPYIVCRADTETAWVSANSGGQYDALNICNSLGYTYLADWGGTCGTVCGYCGSGGLEHYDGTGYTNENFLSTTVTWLCSNTAPVASGSVEVDEALAGTADGITPDAIASLEASPEYNGENGNGGSTEPGSVCFDYYTYVTQDTPITLSCEDVMPHPVGGEVIGFKVYNDGEDITESYCNLGREECDGDFCEKVVEFPGFGMEYDGEYCLVTGMMLREAELLAKGFAGVSYEFDFNEDSEHVLKWYCEDALGNRKDMADQFYYVETVPPVTELEITGPQYTADGVTWTDTETRYELDAYDPEPHPSGVNRTYYAWALVDDAYCWGEATMEDVGTCLLVDTAHEYSAETPYDEDLEVEVLYGTDGMVTFTATTPITFVDGSQDNVAFTFDANNDGEANFQMSYHADQGSHYDGDYWGYREVVGGSWTSWMVLPTWVSVSESGMDTFSVTFDLDHLGGCGADYRFGVAGWGVSTQITPGQNVPFSFPETFSWGPNWVESDDYHAESAPVDFAVYEGEFDIPEESCHAIAFYSVDNLGNTENVSTEYVFVDKTPPIIEKSYEGPFHVVSDRYSDEYGYGFTMSKYIHPDNTLIHLWAEDAWPHPSGLAKAEYRITQVADEYCVQGEYWEWDNGVGPREYVEPEPVNVECDAEGEGDWTEFDGYVNVTVGQESCHVIEVRAWDNVEKYSEHTQCVFVDGTPPETNKLVGKPSSNMAKLDIELGEAYFGPESGFEHAPFLNETFCAKDPMNCLEVTLHTPIQLRCEDPEPHPSGIAGVYFMVHRNGDSMTEDYCGDGVVNDDGYCYVEGGHEGFFQFSNLSWHRLEYYCVDNVGNVGESDVEYFKVDGVAFNLTINKKWNLVSTPVFLREDALDAIFAEHGDKIVSVWAYDPYDGWLVYSPNAPSTLDTMEPGSGYWILATEDFELVVGGSLLRPGPQPLPGKLIKGGWNLIGYLPGRDGALVAGSDPVLSYSGPAGAGKEVHCALESIATDYLQVISSSLWTYWEPDSSAPWHPLDQWTDRMDPGAGYWYYYQTQLEDAMYVPPSNICSDIVS